MFVVAPSARPPDTKHRWSLQTESKEKLLAYVITVEQRWMNRVVKGLLAGLAVWI